MSTAKKGVKNTENQHICIDHKGVPQYYTMSNLPDIAKRKAENKEGKRWGALSGWTCLNVDVVLTLRD